jgi:hypothetical protein
MSEHNLKREFSQRDVQRMRNILTNNAGAATGVQLGYNKQSTEHVEGDIWEENGRKWTIKNGLKQTVTKFDELKKLTVLPLLCPKCNKTMKNHDTNKKMYSIHGMCLDCVVKMETQLKIEGKYDNYTSGIMNLNKNQEVDDFEQAIQEWLSQQNESYISEAGDVETWKGGKISDEEIRSLKEYIAKLRELKI